jgi:hypothetical protein
VRAVLLFSVLVLFCGAAAAQAPAAAPSPTPAAAAGIEEVYLARDDGSGKAGEQVTDFRTSDIPIYCVILLESDVRTVVKMNFVAVSVTGVKAETKVVTATYTTKEGQNRVNFTGRPDGKWTAGKYRVDIFIDGKIAKTLEFQIKGSGGSDITAAKYIQPPAIPKPKGAKRAGKP